METGVRKPIEQLQVGEMVLCRNEFEHHGPLELKRVKELFTRTSPIIDLEIGGPKIGTTDEHRFYVPDCKAFVPARELQVGDQLISHDGCLLRIDAIHSTLQIATVYNLRVADYHTYFVGCDEWGSASGRTMPAMKSKCPELVSFNYLRTPGGKQNLVGGPKTAAEFEAWAHKAADAGEINLSDLRAALAKSGELKGTALRLSANELPVLKPGSDGWQAAVKQLRVSSGKGQDFRVAC